MISQILGLSKSLESSGTENPSEWFLHAMGGRPTASGERVNADTALSCAAVKAAVSVLAETVAMLPLDIFERLPNGGRRAAPNHPVQRLIQVEPNPEMSSLIWRETKQGHLGLWGNGYSEIERAIDGTPLALWLRSPRPNRTRPARDDNNQLFYELHDKHGTREPNVAPANMLHIPGFGFDGIIGYSPIGLAREAIGGNLAAERYAAELFKNDAAERGHYEMPGKMSKPAYKRLQGSLEETSATHGSRHRTHILEEGMKFAGNSMNPDDVQMIEARQFGVIEIARFYRITPHLLQDLTHGTFSNVTELGRQFVTYTMMPWFQRWLGEINRKLLEPPFFAKFNTRALLAANHKERAEFYAKLFQVAGITVNRILELEDENDIGPIGDVRFVPMNMVTLEQAIAGPPKPLPPAEPAPVPDEPEDPEEPQGQESNAKQRAACEAVLDQVIGRMLSKESKAAKRSASSPAEFQSRLNRFYGHHPNTMTDAIAPAVRACLVAHRQPATMAMAIAEAIATQHIAASREDLLTASECQAGELLDKVTQCVENWNTRRSNIGEIINECQTDAA